MDNYSTKIDIHQMISDNNLERFKTSRKNKTVGLKPKNNHS